MDAALQAAQDGARTLIMGVLNVTPDSFSDGGQFLDADDALRQAEKMLADGADILDVGGESTRPATFATNAPLPVEEELRRVTPVIAAISRRFPEALISIDTYKAEVARSAADAGAVFINDISALRADPGLPPLAAARGLPVCLMHMPGLPANIARKPKYGDVVADVCAHLAERVAAAERAGIARSRIVVDPGFGFGKSVQQNLALLRRLREIAALGYPVLVGASRKSTIGAVLGDVPPTDRKEGTAATVALAIANGAAIVRVHDVREMALVARMADAVVRGYVGG